MNIYLACSTNVFTRFSSAFVTDTDVIITDSTTINYGKCGLATPTTLSDLVLFPTTTEIPSWAWTTEYLALVNGKTYPFSLAGETPYIKGLSFQEAYLPHLVVDLLRIPFPMNIVRFSDANMPLTDALTETLVVNFTYPVDGIILFLGGLYIPPEQYSANGTQLTVTIPSETLEALKDPPRGITYASLETVGHLLHHPGTFFVKATTLCHSTTPVGKSDPPVFGTPPIPHLPGISKAGHLLSYRYQPRNTTRFRYCATLPTQWLRIAPC